MSRQMSLGAFLMATGHHIAAWRHPDVPADPLDFAVNNRSSVGVPDGSPTCV